MRSQPPGRETAGITSATDQPPICPAVTEDQHRQSPPVRGVAISYYERIQRPNNRITRADAPRTFIKNRAPMYSCGLFRAVVERNRRLGDRNSPPSGSDPCRTSMSVLFQGAWERDGYAYYAALSIG